MRKAIALALTVPALAVALSGCSAYEEYVLHEKELHFDSYTDAPQAGDLAFVPPGFVPTDAEDISIRTITNGPGAIIRYTSSTEPAGDCTEGELGDVSLLDAEWWPYPAAVTGTRCGDWRIFVDDDVTYAWTRS